MEQVVIAGARFCEVAFFHRASATLVLTDTVVNREPRKLAAPMAILIRLAGAAAPRSGAPLYLRALILLKRSQAIAAVRRFVALSPKRVIFAHRAWFEDRGAERLRHAFGWLIGGKVPPTAR